MHQPGLHVPMHVSIRCIRHSCVHSIIYTEQVAVQIVADGVTGGCHPLGGVYLEYFGSVVSYPWPEELYKLSSLYSFFTLKQLLYTHDHELNACKWSYVRSVL